MKKRAILVMVIVLALAGFMFAGDTAEGSVIELRFLDVIPSPARSEHFQKIVDDYNAQADGVRVTFETVAWDQAYQRLVTSGATNTMPDVFVMHPQWFAEFIQAGWVLNMDEFYENFIYRDLLLPFVSEVLIDYDFVQTRGGVYGIPNGITTHAMFVRSDWVEEAGMTLDDLEYWDGIFEAAERMTDPERSRYGFGFRGARGGGDHMGMYPIGVLSGMLFDANGVNQFSRPEAMAAIERFTDMYKNGWSPADAINWGYTEMVQGFTSNLVGILNQNTEVIRVCSESMEDGTWTTIPFPRSNDGNIYTKADSFVLSIGADTRHAEAAFDFITYMTSPEVNIEYCRVNLFTPVVKGAEDDPYFTEGPMNGFFRTMNDPNFVRQPFYGYFPELAEFMEIIYHTEMQRYLLGQITLEEFVLGISDWLTTHQQAFMAENPDVPVPMPRAIN